MKTFANLFLCCVILVLGTVAIQNFTVAESDPVQLELSTFDLTDSDLDKINGIVDEKIDTVREDMQTLEDRLNEKIAALQTQITDCSTRDATLTKIEKEKAEQVLPAKTPEAVKSSSVSSGAASKTVYTLPIVVPPTVVPVVKSSNHWSYPGDITTHLQTAHGQSVSGMSIEQQLRLHDSLHESKPTVSRTVTRQTSNCPGGVCPTNYNSTSRTYTRPRLFGR